MRPRTFCILFFFLAFAIGSLAGQTYTLHVESAPYEPIQGGQPLVSDPWDDPDLTIPVGFEFDYFSNTIQTLYLRSSFNFISLTDNASEDIASVLILFGADLLDRGILENDHLSPIVAQTTGNPGSRVFTVEWVNAGFYTELLSDGVSSDYVNFQLKFFEANGDIVFHYGPNSISMPQLDYAGNFGPYIGLAEHFDFPLDTVTGEVYLLTDDPLNPDVINEYGEYFLEATVPENTVYRFSKPSTGILANTSQRAISWYYPNPTDGLVYLSAPNAEKVISAVQVYSLTGCMVMQTKDIAMIDMEGLASGIYELRFLTRNGIHVERVVVLPD